MDKFAKRAKGAQLDMYKIHKALLGLAFDTTLRPSYLAVIPEPPEDQVPLHRYLRTDAVEYAAPLHNQSQDPIPEISGSAPAIFYIYKKSPKVPPTTPFSSYSIGYTLTLYLLLSTKT
jgi:hypothetical protein